MKHSPSSTVPKSNRQLAWISLALAFGSLTATLVWQYRLFAGQGFYAADNWRDNIYKLIAVGLLQAAAFGAVVLALRFPGRALPVKQLGRTILAGFAMAALICLFIKPTRSQDFYHDALLLQHWIETGVSPYVATPIEAGGRWLQYVQEWQGIPFVYGPLFALITGAAVALGGSLGGALLITKLLAVAAALAIARLIWLLTDKKPDRDRWLAVALFLFNPLTIQTALIDVHGDIFLALGIIASYFCLTRRRYGWALFWLAVVSLSKFIGIILVPVVLAMMWRDRRRLTYKPLITAGAASLLLAGLTLAPFGWPPETDGFRWMASFRGLGLEGPGALAMLRAGLDPLAIRIVGMIGAMVVGIWLTGRGDSRRYTLPLAVFILFGLTLVQPWYLLWLLPLVAVSEPWWLMIIISIPFTQFTPTPSGRYTVTRAVFIICLAILFMAAVARLDQWSGRSGGKRA